MSSTILIRLRFQGYHCDSGIIIFTRKVTWNQAYCPFKDTWNQAYCPFKDTWNQAHSPFKDTLNQAYSPFKDTWNQAYSPFKEHSSVNRSHCYPGYIEQDTYTYIYIYTYITRNLWNRKSTFRLKAWLFFFTQDNHFVDFIYTIMNF